jgi:hypothetical protein
VILTEAQMIALERNERKKKLPEKLKLKIRAIWVLGKLTMLAISNVDSGP